MTAKKMGECILCGKEYEVCKFCPSTAKYTPWRRLCDSSRHFQIYMVVQDLRSKTITPSEAKEQLDYLKVTFNEVKSFVPSVQETLLPLYETKKIEKKSEKSAVKAESVK